jgi:hypothetical protein
MPNKRACRSLRVVRELDAVDALGPQGAQLRDLVGAAARLTVSQLNGLDAAWAAARDAARDAARAAARAAAWAAARDAARDAARAAAGAAARDAARAAAGAAARALSVRDLINTNGFTQTHYDLLTGPWATNIGKVHPADPDRMIKGN